MTLDERLQIIAERMNVLNERTKRAMNSINRLSRIADDPEDRVDGLEHPAQ